MDQETKNFLYMVGGLAILFYIYYDEKQKK